MPPSETRPPRRAPPGGVGVRALTLALLCATAAVATSRALAVPHERGGDLASVVTAARLLLRGQPDHLYDHDPARHNIADSPEILAAAGDATSVGAVNPFLYPPLYAWLAQPLARWPFAMASLAWGWAVCAAALLSFLVAWRTYGDASRPAPLLLLALTLPVLHPFTSAVLTGNVTPLLALGVFWALALQRRGHSVAAGLVLSIPAAVKLTPALLAAPWLLRGDRNAIRALLAGWAAWLGLSAALCGVDTLAAYLVRMWELSHFTVVAWNNHSLSAYWNRWLYPRPLSLAWGLHPHAPLASAATALAVAAGVALVARAAARSGRPLRESPRALDLIAALCFAAIPLVSTLAWSHHFVLLAPAFFAAAASASGAARWWLLAALALLCSPLAPDQVNNDRWTANAIVPGHTFAALIVAGVLISQITRALARPDAPAEGPRAGA